MKLDITEVDTRRLLSHSGFNTLLACPRKYQMNKLPQNSNRARFGSVDTAYGNAVGAGIQEIFASGNLDKAIVVTIANWNISDCFVEITRTKKSIFGAILVVEKFFNTLLPEYQEEGWELATIPDSDKPACEVSFGIVLPNNLGIYRGSIDIILYSKPLNMYKILEIKTSGSYTVDPNKFRHSFQGIGYGVVLDAVAPKGCSDFYVDYLVITTPTYSFFKLSFVKTAKSRAGWVSELLSRFKLLDTMILEDSFIQNGEACTQYSRACIYIDNECYDTTGVEFQDIELDIPMASSSLVTTTTTSHIKEDVADDGRRYLEVDILLDFGTILSKLTENITSLLEYNDESK